MFQFYDSPIKRREAILSACYSANDSFNSMIVRLKEPIGNPHELLITCFNSMIVRLKDGVRNDKLMVNCQVSIL